jgi:small subunit ribosomal protein S4
MLKGDTSENLIGLLERRLDAIIYRAKFATTIFSARQLINHGHVKVNGKKVNIASCLVKEEILLKSEINLNNLLSLILL